ncbi:aminotransferase class V-fold PLP-dependent enzyme [Micromonospora peucetia]|uniref:Aminotransferase class V-fold PLP-dependent enzyme n=1 Tax=Micromonospora peucetia TaxID=47871 RepID=A0A1C6VQ57_9ACTN|nr:aminotransferase class V-fold PLP-dependent enzyme [Micromonospora peucetia]MCX4388607.1 aminotransferase class V-fold PLP-dependent enzyme [Micromonospora peucetia]WSA30740.1 aminotransferase class V-fold PLP-dependent enzyme [Micromonospora peucetia]SCL68080.1 cysteine desulfurase [Micromonospora peucetia]
MSASPVYLDAATAAPLHPVARQALLAALDDGWADPGRLYTQARRARQLLDAAREAAAQTLGVRADELSFTPSGTTAAHSAVLGGLAGRRRVGPALVHSAIEHSAVLHAAERHIAAGGTATSVPVDRLGRLDLDGWAAAVRSPGVALAALIAASHEVGTLQPVTEAARECAESGVPLYLDAAQLVGRAPVPVGWSVLSASAHKWGGPPGVGLLVVRKGTRWESPWPTDEREAGRTPGTLNLPAVVAAAASLRAAAADAAAEAARLTPLVDRIRARVAAEVPDVEVVGDPDQRLPHLVTFSCLYVDGEALLHALDRRGFAVSSGSSCTSSTLRPSHVLEAMGVLSHGNVRVSLHRETTEADVERFLTELPGIVAGLRAEAGVVGL